MQNYHLHPLDASTIFYTMIYYVMARALQLGAHKGLEGTNGKDPNIAAMQMNY